MHGGDSSFASARPRFSQVFELGGQIVTHWKYSIIFYLAPDWYLAAIVDRHAFDNAVTGTLLSLESVDLVKSPGLYKSYIQSLVARTTAETLSKETHPLLEDVKAATKWFSTAQIVLCVDPKAKLDQCITCNKKLLRHAFAIVLSNAIEASYKTPVIVKVLEYGSYTTVVINDSGKGMSWLDQLRCTWFGWSNKQRGQGLGLGAAKWILAKYCRAGFTIYSSLGVGTTAICVFPR